MVMIPWTNPDAKPENRKFEVAEVAVSFFSSIDPTPVSTISVSEALQKIKSGAWQAEIERLRHILRTLGKRGYDDAKKQLPGITWSPRFVKRNKNIDSLEVYSGFLCFDFDRLEDAVADRGRLEADPHVYAAFISPGGDGLKVLIKTECDASAHVSAYKAGLAYFKKEYGLTGDSTHDISRLCFVSYDPGSYINERASLFAPAVEPDPEQAEINPWDTDMVEMVLVLPSGHVNVTQSAKSIFRRIGESKTMFNRGGRVVEVVEETGEACLSIVRAEEFTSRMERYGRIVAWRVNDDGKAVLKPVPKVPVETSKVLLATLEARALPSIATVMHGPVAVDNGTGIKMLGDGWHDVAGGIFIKGSVPVAKMARAEVAEALGELVGDFAFVTPSDRARAIAALIAPALKLGGILAGHYPFTIAEADQSQTGNGYFFDLQFAIYGEIPGVVGERKGGVGSFDESLAQKLIEGRPFVLFDNLRGRIDSPYLEAILTAPGSVPARVPHRGEVQVDPSHFLFCATSNGVAMTRDLANRSNIIRLKKRTGYRFKSFPEGDLLEHVRANRSRYLSAVLTLVSEYVRAGKPKTGDLRGEGRFRPWWQSMDWILQELLGEPPLLDGHGEAQERTSNPVLTWLREICLICRETERLAEDLSATTLAEISEEHGVSIPGVKPGIEGAANRTVGLKLSQLFRETERLEIDGFEVSRVERTEQVPSGGWRPMKFYRILNLVWPQNLVNHV